MPRLLVGHGQPNSQAHPISPGLTLLGRSPDNQVSILHESVSRYHAQLDLVEGRALLTDRSSTRGTFVNGVRVQRHELRHGDVIHLGEIACCYEAHDPAPEGRLGATVMLGDGLAPLRTRGLDGAFGRATLAQLEPPGGPSAPRARPGAEQKLRTLLQVSQILSGPEPIEALLSKILDLVFQLLGVSRAVLLLVDEASGELVPRLARPAGQEDSYSRSVVRHAREHGELALFADVAHDARLNGAQSVFLMDIRTAIAAPLRAHDRLLGVLYLDHVASAQVHGDDDLDFVSAFASQAAIALENAELYRKIEREAVLRSRFERFFPPATAREITASGSEHLPTVDTEVTALFADISGYTAMTSHMAPREVVALLNEYFGVVSPVVLSFEGVIEKYIGDALLAVWGAPHARPDDADRALATAVAMLRALGPFNERRAARGLPTLAVHIGLNSGPVAAGNIGSEQYLQYATIGDTTNVASRVCSAAGADEILVADATWQRLRGPRPPAEPLDPVSVKGKAEPLRLWRVNWR